MKGILNLKLIAVLFAAFAALAALAVSGGAKAAAETAGGAVYDDCYITADVGENKVIHVVQKLNVGFLGGAESYEHRIPATGKTGAGRKFIISALNFSARTDGVDTEATCSREGSLHFISVYRPQKSPFLRWTEENQLTYEITLEYDLDMSDDIDGENALDFTFFGEYTGWRFVHDGGVARVFVTVNMPKEFNSSAVQLFFDGKNVSGDSSLSVSGTEISFVSDFSDVNGGFLRVGLDDGYFKCERTFYSFYWVFVALFAALVAAGIILTVIYSPRKPLETVEFEPPILNPMHFSAFWHGYARRRDVCTVILQWANLGCIKLKKDGGRDLIITKIKDLPQTATDAEKLYFSALFSEGGVYRSADMKKREKRRQRRAVRFAAGSLVDEFGEPVTYAKGVERAKFFVRYIPVFTLVVLFTYYIILSRYFAGIVFLYMAAAALIGFTKFILNVSDETKGMRNRRRILLAFGLGTGTGIPAGFGIIVYFAAAEMFLPLYDYIYLTYIAIAWAAASVAVLPSFIGKRTEEAQRLYGKMKGFKNFLKLAEVKQMEELISENPDYYLNVLPYCMIMGLSKKLDKKTEFLQAPEWADGFETKRFASSLFSSVKHSVITRKGRKIYEKE